MKSALVPVTEELDVEAKADASMKRKVPGWAMPDSIVLSTSRNRRGIVVTSNPYFRGLVETYDLA